jgi:hypothetical protein
VAWKGFFSALGTPRAATCCRPQWGLKVDIDTCFHFYIAATINILVFIITCTQYLYTILYLYAITETSRTHYYNTASAPSLYYILFTNTVRAEDKCAGLIYSFLVRTNLHFPTSWPRGGFWRSWNPSGGHVSSPPVGGEKPTLRGRGLRPPAPARWSPLAPLARSRIPVSGTPIN